MLRQFTKRSNEASPEGPRPDWPHLHIIFLGRGDHEETDACFQTPVVPRVAEYLALDGYFLRCGGFVVERVSACRQKNAPRERPLEIQSTDGDLSRAQAQDDDMTFLVMRVKEG